jgi:hypothetical protein
MPEQTVAITTVVVIPRFAFVSCAKLSAYAFSCITMLLDAIVVARHFSRNGTFNSAISTCLNKSYLHRHHLVSSAWGYVLGVSVLKCPPSIDLFLVLPYTFGCCSKWFRRFSRNGTFNHAFCACLNNLHYRHHWCRHTEVMVCRCFLCYKTSGTYAFLVLPYFWFAASGS